LFSELKPTLHGLVMHDKVTVPKNKIKKKMVNTCKIISVHLMHKVQPASDRIEAGNSRCHME
jgi:hypothetical protein